MILYEKYLCAWPYANLVGFFASGDLALLVYFNVIFFYFNCPYVNKLFDRMLTKSKSKNNLPKKPYFYLAQLRPILVNLYLL